MKYTNEQYAKKLAEMCRGAGAGCVLSTATNGELDDNYCFICTYENMKVCETVEPLDWLAYLRRWPGHKGDKNDLHWPN